MRTVRVNLKNIAPCQYSNFDFQSFCRFNGVQLAAGDGGFFRIGSGNKDVNTNISAWFEVVTTNFGSLNEKNCRHVYIGGSGSGKISVTVTNDEDGTEAGPYQVEMKNTGAQARRADTGRGLKFYYAKFKVANVSGSNFVIDQIDAVINDAGKGDK